MFFPLLIFTVVYQSFFFLFFYKPCYSVELLNKTKRQVQVEGHLRAITVIQEKWRDSLPSPQLKSVKALNVTANWTWGGIACYGLNGKTWARHCLVNFLFLVRMSVCVCVCMLWPSILSDKFNRALAALTGGVNVSYFIRNPKEEG